MVRADHGLGVWLAGAFVAVACAPTPAETVLRSPSHDYPTSQAQTSNGEVLGADQEAPEDRLRASGRVGTRGLTPADGPAPPEHPSTSPSRKAMPDYEKKPRATCAEAGVIGAAKDPACWSGHSPGK